MDWVLRAVSAKSRGISCWNFSQIGCCMCAQLYANVAEQNPRYFTEVGDDSAENMGALLDALLPLAKGIATHGFIEEE